MIGIVVTNYNNSKLTIDLIESLSTQSYQSFKLCVVDCASSEDQKSKLRTCIEQKDDRFVLLPLTENIGYFPGINEGLRFLGGVGALDCVVIGNNDLIFPSDFCSLVRSFFLQNPHQFVLAPDIMTLTGEHQNPHVRNRISAMREKIYDLYYSSYFVAFCIGFISRCLGRLSSRGDEDTFATAGFIEQGFGAVYVLGPKFFKSFDRLESPSFLYHEEAFLTTQLSRIGERVYYDPSIRVVHVCKGSTSALQSYDKWKIASKSHWELRAVEKSSGDLK